jgi:hypothetical protein
MAKARVRAGIENASVRHFPRLLIGGSAVIAFVAIAAALAPRHETRATSTPTPIVAPARPITAAPSPIPNDVVQAPAVAAPTSLTRHHRRHAAVTTNSPDSGNELVVEAMHRLRRENDPAGAIALLDEYLSGHPDGVLVEEALALSVEASRALDPALAAKRATQYLSRYPDGRFAAEARAAINDER